MDNVKIHGEIFSRWEPVIGLEVHIQLGTRTKMFCRCECQYGNVPNSSTCPVCLGLPGALPVVNEQAVEWTLKMGIAVGGRIRTRCRFARKNYFYPDLPKGYQISQYDEPFVEGGSIQIWWEKKLQSISIDRIHLEEDAGKSIHDKDQDTLLDFNRCGVPLLEIVTEPVLRFPEQARQCLIRLRQFAHYLGISEANMEMGQLRCDANISLRPVHQEQKGTKTEIKNMNSIRAVERALWYEINRQAGILEEGGEIEQGTFLWNEEANRAELMRTKEDAPDYRYFPDPDLVPVTVDEDTVNRIRNSIPELPPEKEQRWMRVHGLRLDDARVLADDLTLANYYDSCISQGIDGRTSAKWIQGEVLRLVKDGDIHQYEVRVSPKRLAELIKTVQTGIINQNTGKVILAKMLSDGRSVQELITDEGLEQLSDTNVLESLVDDVLAANVDKVRRYCGGEVKFFGFFMGQIMRTTKGKSNPGLLKQILEHKLGNGI